MATPVKPANFNPDVPGGEYRHAIRETQPRINLQQSEGLILQAAAQIYSSYIIAGQMATANEQQLINQAVDVAVRMAKQVDARIISGEEAGPDKVAL